MSATLSFEKLHRWQSVFPWREWRTGRQLEQSKLIADEFAKLAEPEPEISRRADELGFESMWAGHHIALATAVARAPTRSSRS